MLLQQLVFLWICCITAESNGFAHDAAEKPTESGERWSASPLGRMRLFAQKKLLQSSEESTCGNSLEDCNRLNEELYDAALDGESNTVQELISKGAEVSSTNLYKSTPLHAAAEGGHVDIVEMLIEAGADINAQNEDKTSALHFAAHEGHLDVVKILVGAGAKVDAQNIRGTTALFFAAQEGHLDVVKILVKAGATVDLKTNKGVTPLINVAGKSNLEVAKFLLKSGANVDAATLKGATPLHLAAYAENPNMVQLFLDNEAEIDAKLVYTGETPSLTAAMYGSGEALEVLKKAGADLEIKDDEGNKIQDLICLCREFTYPRDPCREGTCGEREPERIEAILKG